MLGIWCYLWWAYWFTPRKPAKGEGRTAPCE